eukprot:98951-Chlamydomonas_euryale.AAC.2
MSAILETLSWGGGALTLVARILRDWLLEGTQRRVRALVSGGRADDARVFCAHPERGYGRIVHARLNIVVSLRSDII